MPIRPENKHRYPKNWAEIRAKILERADNKCEWCGVPNYSYREASGAVDCGEGLVRDVKVVLTIAHLDHTPENNDPDNLKALCQRCHNGYDAPMRRAGIRQRKNEREGQKDLFNPIKIGG